MLIEVHPASESGKKSLFKEEDESDFHIFKLKKNSMIVSMKVLIDQQMILGNDKYQLKLKIFLN